MSDSTNQASNTPANLEPIPVTPEIIQEGAGKAYQSVAQSTAIAIQDATDNLRNINTISTTAMGVAISQLLATGDEKYITVITQAQSMAASAVINFETIGQSASKVLQDYAVAQ